MTEHGILFQAPMIRALLDGRKDVTRRTSDRWAKRKAGDRLWVREAWNARALTGAGEPVEISYRAGGTRTIPLAPDDANWREPPRWTPSIHMPRWASRITLEVVSVTREIGLHPSDTIECHRCLGTGRHATEGGGRCRECWGTGRLQGEARLLPAVTNEEARREGVADRAAYLRLWTEINGDTMPDHLWRIEFRRVEVPGGR